MKETMPISPNFEYMFKHVINVDEMVKCLCEKEEKYFRPSGDSPMKIDFYDVISNINAYNYNNPDAKFDMLFNQALQYMANNIDGFYLFTLSNCFIEQKRVERLGKGSFKIENEKVLLNFIKYQLLNQKEKLSEYIKSITHDESYVSGFYNFMDYNFDKVSKTM